MAIHRSRKIIGLLLVLFAILASGLLFAQYQKAPPDFGGTYSFPTPTHPEPRAYLVRLLDIVMLMAGLGMSAWLILKRRSRNGVMLLSIGRAGLFRLLSERLHLPHRRHSKRDPVPGRCPLPDLSGCDRLLLSPAGSGAPCSGVFFAAVSARSARSRTLCCCARGRCRKSSTGR